MIVTEAHLLINRLPKVIHCSDRSMHNLLKLLPLLPASNTGVFEFRIFPPKDSIDYSQPVHINNIGKLETLRNYFNVEIPHDKDLIMWEKFKECIRQIKNKNNYLHKWIRTIWLEYDNEKMEKFLPSLFFSLRKRLKTDLKFEACNKLLSIFNDGHSFNNDFHLVEDLIKKSHFNVTFFSFGIMLPRRCNEIKLVVGPGSIAVVNDVISKLPYGDNYILPDKFLSRFHNHNCNISFSISNGILADISVELICFNNKKSKALKAAIENFIISEHITTASFIRSFLYADKTIIPSQTKENWPDSLIFKSLYSEKFTFPKLEFYFNHIKVCYRNKTLALLKAYLYYRFSCRR